MFWFQIKFVGWPSADILILSSFIWPATYLKPKKFNSVVFCLQLPQGRFLLRLYFFFYTWDITKFEVFSIRFIVLFCVDWLRLSEIRLIIKQKILRVLYFVFTNPIKTKGLVSTTQLLTDFSESAPLNQK